MSHDPNVKAIQPLATRHGLKPEAVLLLLMDASISNVPKLPRQATRFVALWNRLSRRLGKRRELFAELERTRPKTPSN